jgi:putative component of membrane protein insertase Oxa1/YidC/SpoIIIJ protein YidD
MPFPEQLALTAIRFYQRRLSPHKGFRCAHAALHGGESCSGAVARIVREEGLLAGRQSIAGRFRDCRAAHAALKIGAPLSALSFGANVESRGVCCVGPCPIPFRCG